jgi:uncharacterized delta-60 repeat protein
MQTGRSRSPTALAAALLITLALAADSAAAPGDFDPTFSSDGRLWTRFRPGPATIAGLAVLPNGKIVAAGYTGPEAVDDIALARYRPNGRLDRTFGGDGKVRTRIGPGSDEAHAVVVQPDGKVVTAGSVQTGSDYDVVLVRYRRNGRLDRTFGGDGKVRTSVGTFAVANALTLQPNGKILAAGTVGNAPDLRFALFRYLPDGRPDRSFGPNQTGRVSTSVGTGFAQGAAVALQRNGKIVVAGSAETGPDTEGFALVRFRRNGTLDPTFSGGRVTTQVGTGGFAGAHAVAIQADGKIVAAGEALDPSREFALVRYNRNGSPDMGFGVGGKLTTPIGDGDSEANAVAVQPNGRIVAAGFGRIGSAPVFALARYKPDGSLDGAFGSGGIALRRAGPGHSIANAVALQPGRGIVAGGEHLGRGTFALVRLLPSFPTVSIRGDSRLEGDSGTRNMWFRVRLTVPAGSSRVDVPYSTVEVTAVAPQDYRFKSGTLPFSGARVGRWIRVEIVGDRRREPNERFRVKIAVTQNAALGRARARGTIRNDD